MSSALRLFTAEIPMWFSDTSNNTQEPDSYYPERQW